MVIVATTPPQTPPAVAPTLVFLPEVGESADELGAVVEDAEAKVPDDKVLKTVMSESDEAMSG